MEHARSQSTPQDPCASAPPPLQIELRFRLDVDPATAFDLVSNRLPEWFGAIHAVRWDHTRSTAGPGRAGACSERVCDFGGRALHEEVVSFEPGRRYSYRALLDRSELKMPIAEHLGSFDVVADGGGSVITWRQRFRTRWFMPTAMMRWQMRDRMMRPAVEVLIARHGGGWVTSP